MLVELSYKSTTSRSNSEKLNEHLDFKHKARRNSAMRIYPAFSLKGRGWRSLVVTMCVGIPGKVINLEGKKAKIKQGDHFHWVDISPLADKVKKGDYLLTYLGAAINKISQEDAREVFKLMDGAGDTGVESSD